MCRVDKSLFLIIHLVLFRLILFPPKEEVGDAGEVGLHEKSQALGVEAVARKVAIVSSVVDIYGKIAIG